MLGLYLHIPFCSHICNYCNFNRGLFDADVKRQYVDALIVEIARAGDGAPADTIFFGGGTPSLLEPDEIGRLIEACRAAFDVAADAEITLETNPETVTVERMRAFGDAGVNRISLGVQSLHDTELMRLGRQHGAARARVAVADIREAGVENLSLDLMLWLPQQTPADGRATVEGLIALGPEHASLYILELYPNAPLREEMARAQWSLAPDDDAADMYLWGLDRLDRAGYSQYEISNVARDGLLSRHNLKYWTDGEWLGFGPGAHSTRGGVRWRNVSATSEYTGAVQAGGQLIAERRILSKREGLEEALFTRLRLTEGIDLELVRSRYGVDVWREYGSELKRFVEAGLLIYDDRRLKLNRAGMLLANEIMTVFLGSDVR